MKKYISVSELRKSSGISKQTIYETVRWYLSNATKNEMVLFTSGGGKYLIDENMFFEVMEKRAKIICRRMVRK